MKMIAYRDEWTTVVMVCRKKANFVIEKWKKKSEAGDTAESCCVKQRGFMYKSESLYGRTETRKNADNIYVTEKRCNEIGSLQRKSKNIYAPSNNIIRYTEHTCMPIVIRRSNLECTERNKNSTTLLFYFLLTNE